MGHVRGKPRGLDIALAITCDRRQSMVKGSPLSVSTTLCLSFDGPRDQWTMGPSGNLLNLFEASRLENVNILWKDYAI
jgi:hypothetical protein